MKNLSKAHWKPDDSVVESLILMGLVALVVAAAFSALALAILGKH